MNARVEQRLVIANFFTTKLATNGRDAKVSADCRAFIIRRAGLPAL
jgi:hypothetical protein